VNGGILTGVSFLVYFKTWAIDGRIVRCGIISSCHLTYIVKRFWSQV